jgi:diacylglycerol kinase family enzyme
VDWSKALTASLQGGRERPVSCGEVGGLRFYCVAIVGSPAFWAPAREATRYGDLGRAWQHARIAFRRTFGARLKYQGDGRPRRTALALSLICPLISKALESENALEAAGLDLHDMGDVFRLGLHNMLGDWRRDPGVITETMTRGRVWSRRRVPCLIDGEMHWLARSADIGFVPTAFRALAPLEPPV